MYMECFPIIISAPSGGGKTSIVSRLLEDGKLSRVITATTRAPRKGEKNGKDYHFWSEKQFENAVKKDEMAEWAKVHVNYYGIPKSSLDKLIKRGKHPVLVIDVQGAKTVKKIYKNAVSIFITPPSFAELKKRIAARNDGTTDVKARLESAKKELKCIKNYDYLVINNVFEQAVADCRAIIQAERLKVKRQKKF
ncbi:guanylate kinase [Candidatus Proelusimicrobium excrementi]|uniref:guanylate kinase n=2 Tax=Candidatus Proelusimicrobium excrementi TaxID=3416222 RepID=UPI003D0C8C60